MLYEFAITPEVFDPGVIAKHPHLESSLGVILREICRNGLLANLNRGKWLQLVNGTFLPKLSFELQSEVREYLEYLDNRKRLVPCPLGIANDPVGPEDWFYAANEINGQVPLHGIIVGKKLFDEHCNPALPLIDASFPTRYDAWKDRATTKSVQTNWQTYKENLEPVLRYASKVTLIDPYLRCEGKFLNIIQLCCDLLGQRRNRLERGGYIDIHTKNQDYSRADWEAELGRLDDSHRYEFTVSVWKEKEKGERFHDRYIITNQCGIGIAHGLDMVAGNETTWSLLEEQDRQNELQKFTDAGPFQRVGDKLVIPKRKSK